jgi:hypothetical protein
VTFVKLRPLLAALLTATLLIGAAAVASPASAGGPRIALGVIANQKVSHGGTATIRPAVQLSGNVTLAGASLTVTKGRSVVARNVATASLRPGTYTVTQTAVYRTFTVYGARTTSTSARTINRTQQLVISERPAPAVAAPVDGSCPPWAPIKGNRNSGIYHLPGQRYYLVTVPEQCFSTPAAAVAAGYRAAKV